MYFDRAVPGAVRPAAPCVVAVMTCHAADSLEPPVIAAAETSFLADQHDGISSADAAEPEQSAGAEISGAETAGGGKH